MKHQNNVEVTIDFYPFESFLKNDGQNLKNQIAQHSS